MLTFTKVVCKCIGEKGLNVKSPGCKENMDIFTSGCRDLATFCWLLRTEAGIECAASCCKAEPSSCILSLAKRLDGCVRNFPCLLHLKSRNMAECSFFITEIKWDLSPLWDVHRKLAQFVFLTWSESSHQLFTLPPSMPPVLFPLTSPSYLLQISWLSRYIEEAQQ